VEKLVHLLGTRHKVFPAVVEAVVVPVVDFEFGWTVCDLSVHPDVKCFTVTHKGPDSIPAMVGLDGLPFVDIESPVIPW